MCAEPVDKLRNVGLHLTYDILRRRPVKQVKLHGIQDLDDVDQRFAQHYDYLGQPSLEFPFSASSLTLSATDDDEDETDEQDVDVAGGHALVDGGGDAAVARAGVASLSLGEHM